MRDVFPDIARNDLRVRKDLIYGLNRATGYAYSFQFGDPVVALTARHNRFKQGNEFGAVNNARLIRRKFWVGAKVCDAKRVAKRPELRIVTDRYDHEAIRRFKYLIGHDVLMRIACTRGRDARGHVV